ncbi:hypothetical protein [Streptomyces sp. NPDC003996]
MGTGLPRTRIYLLRFESGLIVGEVQQGEVTGYRNPTLALRGAASTAETPGRYAPPRKESRGPAA